MSAFLTNRTSTFKLTSSNVDEVINTWGTWWACALSIGFLNFSSVSDCTWKLLTDFKGKNKHRYNEAAVTSLEIIMTTLTTGHDTKEGLGSRRLCLKSGTGTWGLGHGAWGLETRDTGRRQDVRTQGLRDMINKQHLIFALNLLSHSLSVQTGK